MSVLKRHNVRSAGDGPSTLVFAHGFGCDQNVWRHVAPAFLDRHRVVQVDLAGYGGSAPGSYDFERHATLEGHAEDLVEICEALGVLRPILVGHSVSSMTALLASRMRPDLLGGVVLVAPSPCYINDGDYVGGFEREDIDQLLDTLDSNYFAWSRMMAPVVMGNADQPDLADDLASTFCRADPNIARHFARVTFLTDSRPDLADVRVPCLVLQCSDDALAPIEVGRYLHRHIAGSELKVLKATGHCPHLSAPRETIAALRPFVARIAKSNKREAAARARAAARLPALAA
ncbi:alpha/beta fold hydrolase [Piscinibacter koreensis]|uniref:Alpha/beta hydrolase n=1 Tax=Piscinibacter koreensis TaxID=2742824 RepID=A0A7Y6NL44_9BURK|nr:alpha/beta hydrolase [Schlegelella koreensis]NUZ05215.1 alpha/beta hydrolase [Schlegelella koreensis]